MLLLALLTNIQLVFFHTIIIWHTFRDLFYTFSPFFFLTLMPSKRDKALRGLKALNVRSDLIAPNSEKPRAVAIKLTNDT